jgi:hypothetical protein
MIGFAFLLEASTIVKLIFLRRQRPVLNTVTNSKKGGVILKAAPRRRSAKKPGRRRPRVSVDADRIVELYVDNKMTLREIAKEVGVSHVTVARIITEITGQLRAWRMPGEF